MNEVSTWVHTRRCGHAGEKGVASRQGAWLRGGRRGGREWAGRGVQGRGRAEGAEPECGSGRHRRRRQLLGRDVFVFFVALLVHLLVVLLFFRGGGGGGSGGGGPGALRLLPGAGGRGRALSPGPPSLAQHRLPAPPAPTALLPTEPGRRQAGPDAGQAGLAGARGARPGLPPRPGPVRARRGPDPPLHPALLPQCLRGQCGRYRQQDRASHGSGQEPPDVCRAGRGGGPEGADQGAGREELPAGTGEQPPAQLSQPRTAPTLPVLPAAGGASLTLTLTDLLLLRRHLGLLWGEAERLGAGSCPGAAPGRLCGVRWLCPRGGQSHRTLPL